jgi:hypothetical protein
MVALLRLSHSVHFAVWTLTTVMRVGSAEQVRSLPSGVRMEGEASVAGVLGAVRFEEPAELGDEAAGVAGGGIGDDAGADRFGGDGVFARDGIVLGRAGLWELKCGVVGSIHKIEVRGEFSSYKRIAVRRRGVTGVTNQRS